MKDIKEMTLEELREEMEELCTYLHMTRELGAYDKFEWNGLDYWDADRRHHKISEEVMIQRILENSK